MKILNKKVYREIIKQNKFRSFVIVITIAVTVGFLFGLANTEQMIYDSYHTNMEKLNTPEVRLHFKNFIDEKNISVLQENTLVTSSDIDKIEGRLYIHAQATFRGKQYDALWIGLNSTKESQNSLDQLRTLKGKNYFADSQPEALIGYQFATGLFGHNVKLGEEIQISYRGIDLQTLNITGTVQSNEFTYNVDERTNVFMLGSRAIIYTSLEWAWNQINQSHVINEMLVSTQEMSQQAADDVVELLTPILDSQKAPIYNYYNSWNTPDKKMFDTDAGLIQEFSFVLGGFALLMGIVLIYNSLTKLINSQRKQIGLMGALGSKRRVVMLHFTKIGIVLGIIGIFFGILFSFIISYLLTYVMTSVYGFKYITLTIDTLLFVLVVIFTIVVVAAFSLLASFPILQITPLEAMKSTFTRVGMNKKTVIEKTVGKLPGFKSISSLIPLRELFIHRKRSSLTIIAIAVSSIILVVSGAMMVDMAQSIDNNFNKYKMYDGKLIVNDLQPAEQFQNNILSITNEISDLEPILYFPVAINVSGVFKGFSTVTAVNLNSTLRDFHIIKGTEPTTATEILMGQAIAHDFGVSVGDTITVSIAVNETTQSSELINFDIVGLVGEMMDYELFTYRENLNPLLSMMNMSNYVNGVLFNLKTDGDFNQLEDDLYRNLNVLIIENVVDTKETLTFIMEVLMEMVLVFILLGLLMTGVFTFNTIYLSYIDREMEYLALRAQGMKRKTLFKILSIETIFLGIVGFIISMPIGYYAAKWGFDYMMEGRFYIQVFIPPELWFVVLSITLISVMIATSIIAWRIMKASMPDVLRNRQIS